MPEATTPAPTGSDYVRAVAQQLIAAGVDIDMTGADLDEEQCNLPVVNGDEIVWLRWLDDDSGWHLDDERGWPAAALCPPDTPVDEAARIITRYV